MFISTTSIYNLYISAAEDIFKGKEVPDWMRNYPGFKDKKIKKVFPSFGIPNFKEEVNAKLGINPDAIAAANLILDKMQDVVVFAYKKVFRILSGITLHADDDNANQNLKLKIDKLKNIEDLLNRFANLIDNKNDILKENKGKLKLIVSHDFPRYDNKIILSAGESIFKAYDKIKNILDILSLEINIDYSLPSIESWSETKNFHKLNVPMSKMFVVFSGSGDKSAWDLATMSMRGISSCQSWDGRMEGEGAVYKECLIGSILSRYVGIIYLTSGSDFEGRGEKMIKRCIVRFGINTQTKKPVIIMDRMYDSYVPQISELFENALQSKTNLNVINWAGKHYTVEQENPNNYDRRIMPNENDVAVPEEEFEHTWSDYHQDKVPVDSYMDTKIRDLSKKKKEQPKNLGDNLLSFEAYANGIISKIYPILFENIKDRNYINIAMDVLPRKIIAFNNYIQNNDVKSLRVMKRMFLTKLYGNGINLKNIIRMLPGFYSYEQAQTYEKNIERVWNGKVRPFLVGEFEKIKLEE